MEIGKILRIATEQFNNNKIKNPFSLPTARREAEILLSHVIKKPLEFLLAHPEKRLLKKQIENYKKLIAKRLRGKPISYLTGHREFYGLDFLVNENVLIPRPETELMVEEAITKIKNQKSEIRNLLLIDVGTGSGCVLVSILKNVNVESENMKVIAIDISNKALDVARKNAKKHGVSGTIKFLQGNLLEPIIHNSKFKIPRPRQSRRGGRGRQNSKLFITANLPYLTPCQIDSSPALRYEPKKALAGGKNGLKYYEELFKQIKQLIKLNLASLFLLCEIDPGQTKKIKKLAQSELPKGKIKIMKDLAGKNRIVNYINLYQ